MLKRGQGDEDVSAPRVQQHGVPRGLGKSAFGVVEDEACLKRPGESVGGEERGTGRADSPSEKLGCDGSWKG